MKSSGVAAFPHVVVRCKEPDGELSTVEDASEDACEAEDVLLHVLAFVIKESPFKWCDVEFEVAPEIQLTAAETAKIERVAIELALGENDDEEEDWEEDY